MAIDTASGSSCSGCASLTWAHTVTGSSLGLYVGGSYFDAGDTITGITYNAVAMTAVPSGLATNGNYAAQGYTLIAPTTGANNVVISATGTVSELSGMAVSFTGAHQTTLIGTAGIATGADTTPTVNVSSAASEIVVDTLTIIHNGTLTVGPGQTAQWSAIGGAGFTKYAASTETGSATTTMSWTNGTSQTWAITAVPIKPAGAAATCQVRTLMGVGC